MTRDSADGSLSLEAREMETRSRTLAAKAQCLLEDLGSCYLGARETLVLPLLHAVLAGCHVLLEGMPGLGKTLLAKALASGMGVRFSRIQCTPDLMPSDITGTEILEEAEGRGLGFHFRPGPVFGNLILSDEINRATPKTQSALLEAMEEGQVTVGGQAVALPEPFSVIGTQNPIEMEGTYPLPEAQLDRFSVHLDVAYPEPSTLERILENPRNLPLPQARLDPAEVLELQNLADRVLVGPHLRTWLTALLMATQPDAPGADPETSKLVKLGASPRAGLSMLRIARMKALLAGRFHVSHEDLVEVALPALRHRVLLGYEARVRRIRVAELLPTWMTKAARVLEEESRS